jgi:hypothetical protein
VIYTTDSLPPGVAGVSCQEIARFSTFWATWAGLQAPLGSVQNVAMGYDTATNSNDIIRAGLFETDPARGGHPGALAMQWVFLMDDDHAFAPDLLLKLLAHNVDVVMPLYVQRRPPFWPCIFRQSVGVEGYPIYSWEDLQGESGLLKVASAGKGGVLIRRHVIEKICPEWIAAIPGSPLRGPSEPGPFSWLGRVGEDHSFYQRCRDAGFGVYCDLDQRIDHITPMHVRAYRDPLGRWCPELDMHNGQIVRLWPERGEPVR